MRHSRAAGPVLITSAPESPEREYEHRRRRYAVMMAFRAVCVIAAALTYRESIWLAIAFVVGGAIVPWCAVIMANDGPTRKARPELGALDGLRSETALPPGSDDRTVDPGSQSTEAQSNGDTDC